MKQGDTFDTSEYWYDLPSDRIAMFPASPRDASRLMVYREDKITHERFHNLPEYLPEGSLLIINDTRVIPARLQFATDGGAAIEIFLLEPMSPSVEPSVILAGSSPCVWRCAVGNLKRWKHGVELRKSFGTTTLRVSLLDRTEQTVELNWSPTHLTLSSILDQAGATPLPPYIKRKAQPSDRDAYQTIYSNREGAVAAPTAGLHFTEQVLQALENKRVGVERITLHVSAGTFRPIKTGRIDDHVMHHERLLISRDTIERLARWKGKIIPVGTTAVRTLESLYWFGVKLIHEGAGIFSIRQEDPYRPWPACPSRGLVLESVLQFMDRQGVDTLQGTTSLYIRPGYRFRFCDALITNFHQPGSTLLVLISAYVGKDWRRLYESALANDYRFLSYGDSSLLFPNPGFAPQQTD